MSNQDASEDTVQPNVVQSVNFGGPSSKPFRVLIVDDLAENRLRLGLCCDQFGAIHEEVASGREAVEAAQSRSFDVILMDILMPGMDGMAATRAIRALPGRVSSVPIIAVTPAAAPGEVLRYLSCGMTDVVPKPVDPARLAEAISAALAQAGPSGGAGRRKAAGRRAAERAA
ncbi:MAG: response regulator [Caulobacteraceae bacterium]|nr:response regulator [Caulobacteraceae bacterium]